MKTPKTDYGTLLSPPPCSAPFWADDLATVYRGECLTVMWNLPSNAATICITDPPYSSGGMMRGDRQKDCRSKYQQSGTEKTYEEFSGDTRDQRGFEAWCSIWMNEMRRIIVPGGILATFVDWRQLPVMTDALQAGGWVWRGVVPWWKPSARPIQGRWKNACEYLVWGTNGPRALEGKPFEGFYRCNVASDKLHMTEKPVQLLQELLAIAHEPDACVIDPFMGSGTTLKAAKQLGKRCIGIEINEAICQVAVDRLKTPDQPALDFGQNIRY